MEQINNIENKTVFITGANGFLATHCIKYLLLKNCKIIGSVRSLKKESNKELFNIVPEKKENLKLVEADLNQKEIWKKITKDCDYLFHIASPVFIKPPKDENKILKPAVEGTKNVLEAAVHNKIKKVVLISSLITASFKDKKNHFFTEKDYSNEKIINLYGKSKLLAEKEAINLKKKYKTLNLTILCPGGIMDETLTSRKSLSDMIMKFIFNSPITLNMSFPIVSARDCAKISIRCLELPEISRDKRYFLCENSYLMSDLVFILKDEFEKYGYFFKRIHIPNFFLWLPTRAFGITKFVYQKLTQIDIFYNDPVKEDLKIGFENHRKVILRTVYDMIKKNKIRNKL